MSNAHVLVVDDEPFNLDIIGDFLADADYRLDMVDSGEAAWARLDGNAASYDLVLLDRLMPGLDGLALLRRIKADPRLCSIPVIMQTAAASPDQVSEGLASGAAYYLTKPFAPESLQTIVRAALDDLAHRKQLAQRLSAHADALRTLQEGRFSFRTLDDAQVLAALAASVCDEPEIVVLGLSELLVNAVEHGNLGIRFADKTRLREAGNWEFVVRERLEQPAYRDRRARLTITAEPHAWVFTIEDDGEGFDWRNYLELAPERAFAPNGRGIALARQLAFHQLEYLGKGNCVRATVKRPSAI